MNRRPVKIRTTIKICSRIVIPIAFICCLTLSTNCWAAGPDRIKLETTSPQKIDLVVGKSIIIQSSEPVKRVSLVVPQVADVMVLTPQQIYVIGKTPGITNLTLWRGDGEVSAVCELEVSPDVARLKEKLYEILPEEKDIRVTVSHDRITLSGTVSSTLNLSQVLALAESYAPGEEGEREKKVINLLEVAGVHQVMLEVRVSEIDRSLLRRLGFNFNYLSRGGTNMGFGMLGNLISPTVQEGQAMTMFSPTVNAIARFFGGGAYWTMFIDALKEDGLLRILAEPTLITLSGKNANFLAGGEFPYPIPQSMGAGSTTITIEFKTFGVGLNFTPTVLGNGKISMEVAPEVSELDFSNAVTFQGFVIPALTTRRVSTVLELTDGQSFAIAGLLKDDVRTSISKYPLLGDIPILGSLFRSENFKKNESELVIIVTPHLVKPLDVSKQTLPTEQYIDPNDFEFYLLGKMEGKEDGKPSAKTPVALDKKGGLEGDFGHIVP